MVGEEEGRKKKEEEKSSQGRGKSEAYMFQLVSELREPAGRE